MRCVLLIGFFLCAGVFPSTVFFVVGHYFVAAGGVLSITGYRQLGINVKEVFYSIPFFFFFYIMIDFFSDLSSWLLCSSAGSYRLLDS